MGTVIVTSLFVLFTMSICIVKCTPKRKNNNKRTLDRSLPTVDARSKEKKKKSSETAIEGTPVVPPKSKEVALKEQATQLSCSRDAAKAKTKTKNKKSKSKEKTVTKTTVTTEYETVDEVTAKDPSEKKNKTVCVTAEEAIPSRREQRTQDASLETAKPKKKKKKPKTEEFLESQGDDDTLKCVKSIEN